MILEQPHNVPVDGTKYNLSKYRTYMLAHDWQVILERDGYAIRFTVKKGYMYDGASVPRIAWSIGGIRPDGLIRAAATLHDPVYEFEGKLNNEWITCERYVDGLWIKCNRIWTRKEADGFFKELLIRAGYNKFKVFMAYQAVRKGGWVAWRT